MSIFSPRPWFQEHLHKESGYEPWIQGLGMAQNDPFLDHFWTTFWAIFGSEMDRFGLPSGCFGVPVLAQKWLKNDPFLGPKWPLFEPFLSHFWTPFWPPFFSSWTATHQISLVWRVKLTYPGQNRSKAGQKVVQKWLQNGSFWTSKMTHFTTFITANGHFRPLFWPPFWGLWAGLAKPANTACNTTPMVACIRHLVNGAGRSWKRGQKRGPKWPLFWPLFSAPEQLSMKYPLYDGSNWHILAKSGPEMGQKRVKIGHFGLFWTPFWSVLARSWLRSTAVFDQI